MDEEDVDYLRDMASEVPVFDCVRRLAGEGLVPGGSRRNLEFVEESVRFAAGVDVLDRLILADAQTSGGLLLAVPPENESQLLAELEARGTLARAVIGEVVAGEPGGLEVVPG